MEMSQLDDQKIQEMAQNLRNEQEKIKKAYLAQRKELDDEMIVSGKSVKDWHNELWIVIPVDNLSPQICIETNNAIMRAHQIAAFEHCKAQMRSQILDKEASSAYYRTIDHAVTSSHEAGKRQPSAATLDTIAEVGSELYKRIAIEGSNELKFWSNVLDHLQFCKKIMEQQGFNLHSDIKSEGTSRFLENLGNRYGGKENE